MCCSSAYVTTDDQADFVSLALSMTWASRVDPGASASSLQAAATPALPERADLLGPLPPNASLPYFTRHGFINTGNSCFANSTLQALLGCTSFHSLLLALRTHEERHGRLAPVYSTLRSLAELAGDFAPREDEPESSGAVHYGKKVPGALLKGP
jgi:Ubiquitin carboxyl-terminal hydrolase